MLRSLRFLAATFFVSIAGCHSYDAPGRSTLEFTAVWTETFIEAGSQFTKEVVADGSRFRILERNASPNATEAGPLTRVYDGLRYYQKDDRDPGFPDTGSVNPSNDQGVNHMRFWMWNPHGKGTSGEPILARETILYESIEPVTDTLFKRWVDKETGLLLKEEQIRAQSNAPKFLREVRVLSIGDVDQSAFSLP